MQKIIKPRCPSRQLCETVNFAFMKIFDFLVKQDFKKSMTASKSFAAILDSSFCIAAVFTSNISKHNVCKE